MPDDVRFFDPSCDVPRGTGHELLRQDGLILQPPPAIPPSQIRGRLWELIYALAARCVYLESTDHVSDAELYSWLYDHWLLNEIPDLEPEHEWNCRVDLVGGGSEADNQIWLRYYADDELREKWKNDFVDDVVPPREALPYDRDRWLPQPPLPLSPQDIAELPELPDDDEAPLAAAGSELNDPLHLEEVDREIHRDQPLFESGDGDAEGECPQTFEEPLVESAVGIETERWETPHDALVRAGVVLPPPDELTDESVPSTLWELLHELACRGFYVLNTDHLDDRELYQRLWREDLREPALLPGRSDSGGWFHDLVGSGSAEDIQIWLQFYADDIARERHALDWPDDPLPPRQPRPFNRDRRLPHGPF